MSPVEGIRLQAERVVGAYNQLRGTAKSSDFSSDDFPVGLFAELFQQIKQLDVWIRPAVDDLHEETGAEIRDEYPDADERELKLRVAIRESFGTTHSEEDAAYDRISEAIS